MNKKEFFSKLNVKNYHNELEKILEKKNFSNNAQNLILNMIYKIELAYKDYENVKKIEVTEGQILEKIVKIIDEKCENIEIVEPNSKKGSILVKNNKSSIIDKKYKTIIAYPIEKEILYDLFQINTKQFKIDEKYYIIDKTLSNTLRNGNSINIKEILRDFNGWSWHIETKDIESFEYNIMFQNLRILVGYSFLYNWCCNTINEKDYFHEMKIILEANYGKADAKNFYENFIQLSVMLNIEALELTLRKNRKKLINEISQYKVSDTYIKKQIIEFQKIFLKCLKIKIEKTNIKMELVKIIYHLRYYKKIPINMHEKIEDITELSQIIDSIENILIDKGINLRILNSICKSNKFNLDIIKKALNTTIINLENLEIEVQTKYSKLQVFIYDGDIFDTSFEIETYGSAEKIKLKRKIKLFG